MNVGLVGYGEVGKIFTSAFVEQNAAWVGAWDILMRDATAAPAMIAHAAKARVEAVGSMVALTAKADVIVSAVTASQAGAVADEVAKSIRPGTWFLDLNSCSPGVKQRSSERIDNAGGRYVESAVMTTVPGYGIRVPMLLGGRHAPAFRDLVSPFGLDMQIADERIGVASATKMCRSVMIKGLESLLVESLTSARHYGVEDRVLASLHETFPELDWEKIASYMMMRTALHGKRRAEEMREVAETVREAGLEPLMASATAERQDVMAKRKDAAGFAQIAKGAGWRVYADRLLDAASAESARLAKLH
jgi:3-hydroxyisobutyrate dehydrogenase-like beta-hydroxyacid dehydrogenase